MHYTFIQAGGTIDKDYSKNKGTHYFHIGAPAVRSILKETNQNFTFDIVSVVKKDSLDLTAKDRERIFDACRKSKSKRIIVTHGTDTMIDTAGLLSKIRGKKIILTGASLPYKFLDSDADFNVGFAMGCLNFVDDGVYIAMNGRLHRWNRCVKRDSGKFFDKK